jgi:VCBS repeat-containing protein
MIERLEDRQLLSGAPPTALDDTYAVGPVNPLSIDSINDGPGSRLMQGASDPGPSGGGIAIGDNQFVMIRFQVPAPDPVRTFEMGGQFGGFRGNGYIFGAIVALTDENDVPDSVDLSTPDVLGTTLIPVFNEADPDRSFITRGKLSVEISRGFYAAVFGSGKFGATSDGFSPFVSMPNSDTYFSSNGGWSAMGNHTIHAFVQSANAIGGVLANDSDPEGDPLTATVEAGPTNGVLRFFADGRFSYDPNDGFTGIDSFRYSVSDGSSQSTATAYINVEQFNPQNLPTTRGDAYFVTPPGPYEGASVLGNDRGIGLVAHRLTGPAHGTLDFRADGTFTYTPEVGFSGEDTFLYRVQMGTLLSAVAPVVLTVAPVNDPPDANDDVYRIEAGETLMSGMGERLATAVYFTDEQRPNLGKIDLDGENLSQVRDIVGSASSIALDLVHNYVYWYIGAAEYRIYRAPLSGGPQELVVQMPSVDIGGGARDNPSVRDLAIDAEAGKLYWTTNSVQEVYAAKVSRSNLDGSEIEDLWTIPQGFPQGIDLDLAARKVYFTNDRQVLRTDMEEPRTVEVVGQSNAFEGIHSVALDVSRGKVYWAEGESFGASRIRRANLDGSGSEGVLALPRNSQVADLAIDPARGRVYWSDWWFDTINSVNIDGTDSQVVLRNGLSNPSGFTLDQQFPDNYIYGVLANDTDLDDDSLTATLVDSPDHGTVELAADGSFKYVPDAGFEGRDTFTYLASDGTAQSAPATVTIFVGNGPPVAEDDEYDISEDEELITTGATGVLANDSDDQGAMTAVLIEGPSHGRLSLAPDGSFSYEPDANFFGEDSFTYQVDDGENLSNVATVTIHVESVNDPPIATPDHATVNPGQSLNFGGTGLISNDSDPEGNAIRIVGAAATPDTRGTVAFTDGMVIYTADAAFIGNDTFTYTVEDSNGAQSVGTVHVRVVPVDQNTTGKANGHGTLDNGRRLFNFNVNSRETSSGLAISGNLWFADLQRLFFFNGTQITGFQIDEGGRLASFSGVGRLNGRSGYEFTVHLEDNSGPNRGRDKFRIEITGRGLDYDSLDHAINGGRIDRKGDIRIQPQRPRPQAVSLNDLVLAGWTTDRYESLAQHLARLKRGG